MSEAKGSVQQYPAAMVNITNRCKNRDEEQEYSFILGFMGRKWVTNIFLSIQNYHLQNAAIQQTADDTTNPICIKPFD